MKQLDVEAEAIVMQASEVKLGYDCFLNANIFANISIWIKVILWDFWYVIPEYICKESSPCYYFVIASDAERARSPEPPSAVTYGNSRQLKTRLVLILGTKSIEQKKLFS